LVAFVLKTYRYGVCEYVLLEFPPITAPRAIHTAARGCPSLCYIL
jgi:hypothetical protein